LVIDYANDISQAFAVVGSGRTNVPRVAGSGFQQQADPVEILRPMDAAHGEKQIQSAGARSSGLLFVLSVNAC